MSRFGRRPYSEEKEAVEAELAKPIVVPPPPPAEPGDLELELDVIEFEMDHDIVEFEMAASV